LSSSKKNRALQGLENDALSMPMMASISDGLIFLNRTGSGETKKSEGVVSCLGFSPDSSMLFPEALDLLLV
jgi:hypothetical protein